MAWAWSGLQLQLQELVQVRSKFPVSAIFSGRAGLCPLVPHLAPSGFLNGSAPKAGPSLRNCLLERPLLVCELQAGISDILAQPLGLAYVAFGG